MIDTPIEYKVNSPDPALSHLVESFWMLINPSDSDKEIVILPDGRIDIFFSYSATEPFHVTLMGLESEATQGMLPAKTIIFAVSFKLLAMEYILQRSISGLLNEALILDSGFWRITKEDLDNFDHFCDKCSCKIKSLLKEEVDSRKQKLFDLIYFSKGAMTVKELSEKSNWSSRQINRYFTDQFGIALKAYCNILRFRASFQHMKEGKLFPEQNFTDQAHFIKEVKKLAGVLPKDLAKNKNDRFIQFSTLPKK